MSRTLSRIPIGMLSMALLSATPIIAAASARPFVRAVQGPEDAVHDRIAYRLETDRSVKRYDLTVKIDGRRAILSGTVATQAERTDAGRLAVVDGVDRVDNQVVVDPAVDGTLLERSKAGLRRSGEAATDDWITTKVKWFYLGDSDLKGASISVTTDHRVVTLTGTVRSSAERTHAVDLANDTDGVLKVVDHLKIVR